jgi:dihydropteroate synthase
MNDTGFSIKVGGNLLEITRPLVMGVINVTPDSFYAGSRVHGEREIRERLVQIGQEGADIIDCGAYSSRPGAEHISTDEERNRLEVLLRCLRDLYPDILVSLDTFRSEIASWAVREYHVNIINDISGGEMDDKMAEKVADLNVPYVMMHMKGTPQTMQEMPVYNDLLYEMIRYFEKKISVFRAAGVLDIIVDPGFGFGKTLDHNYELIQRLDMLHITQCPILVGLSRKSMIYKLLDTNPEEALPGTIALNMLALLKGASFLRVHDVKEAVQLVRVFEKLREFSPV